MSLLRALLPRRKVPEVYDPNPEETDQMPVRPYRILQVDLPFFSDPDCRIELKGARLIVVQCEDPAQRHRPVECMPVVKRYRIGDVVRWEINPKRMWPAAWYVNPENGEKQQAWLQSVEFIGAVVRLQTAEAQTTEPAGSPRK